MERQVGYEIIHDPGEALILDWGKLRDVLDPETDTIRTLWVLVGVMGFSRSMLVRLVWSNSTAVTIEALESMFEELGGIPHKVTTDNPKSVASEASKYEAILNPHMELFAAHCGFLLECLPPAEPKKKGKVERMMQYVRRITESMAWVNLEVTQVEVNRRVRDSNERIHGTTRRKPRELFEQQERAALKPLPSLSFARPEIVRASVRKDGSVRICHKYYTVAHQYMHKAILAIVYPKRLSIYCDGKLLEVYDRIPPESFQARATHKHLLEPWRRDMEKHEIYRVQAQKIGPNCDQFVAAILAQGEKFVTLRKVWGILSFEKKYPPDQIDAACKLAIELNTLSYHAVKSILKSTPGAGHLIKDTVEPKFVRPMSVYEKVLQKDAKRQQEGLLC